ncbi:MAG: glycoside hydrolase family 3 protein [Propionibacteriaceae bacterium]
MMTPSTAADGTTYRDLNGNGQLDAYEDPRLPVDERVDDLVGRLSLAEKVGLMFHTIIEAGTDGSLVEQPGRITGTPTSVLVAHKLINHVNVHALTDARAAARWHNALQELAEQTPHGIPVTVSSDPRHGFSQNPGASFASAMMSQWPEPIGLGAIGDPDVVRAHGEATRAEYAAVGIRAALHPTADLATEPRWGRQGTTFGADPDRVTPLVAAFLAALQGDSLGPDSVAGTTKHFPGGGPQRDGEDAHFAYGREQTYEGDRFADHLAPFLPVLGATAAVMPYYGLPVGLELDLGNGPEAVEEVGFGFNAQIITGLLRDQLGYDGVVLSDWGLVTDVEAMGLPFPARAWGVEYLDRMARVERLLAAGVDQLGGEECVDLVLELVAERRVSETRVDESVRRLLRVKFALGLFDDPYVDEDAAVEICGRADFAAAGHRAQAESVTILSNVGVLPLVGRGRRIYVEGVEERVAAQFGELVATPAEADLAIIRVKAPFEPRNAIFLEQFFHQGSLDFDPDVVEHLRTVASAVPTVLDVTLDRPAILTPFAGDVAALVGTYGCSDQALFDALTGEIAPRGRLPFELPRSMAAVAVSRPDVPNDTEDPLFPIGHGLAL